MDPNDSVPEQQEPNDFPAEDAAEKQQQPGDNRNDVIEAVNILPAVIAKKPEWVKKEAARVVASTAEDDDSRADYLKRVAKQLKLFAGEIPTLGYPAQGATAPHIAIMSKATLHNWARIYDQVLPAKGDYVKSVPLGPKDLPRGQRVEKHMNWQLRYRMPNWATSHQFTMMGWLQQGSRFRYYRWNPIDRIHDVDDLPVEDVIVSYTETDTSPQMKRVERITVVRRMAKFEMVLYQDRGFFSNLADIFPDLKADEEGSAGEDGSTTDGDSVPSSDDDQGPLRDAADKVQGVTNEAKASKYAKRILLEQHGWLEFPKTLGIPGLDGTTRPVIWTVDKKTKKPVSLTLREEPDPVDQERFDQQTAAHAQLTAAILQKNATMAPPIDPETGEEQPLPEPKMPAPPAPVRMNTVHRVIHYRLFPNPEGFYGFGVGWLLEGSNDLANTLAAEFVLAAKFSNMKTGFMARDVREKKGDVQLAHGKFMETNLEPEQVEKAIKVLDFGGPSESLLQFIEKLEENSEISASADILSGEKGSSNETAKGTSIRNANAMSLISVMTRLYLEPLKFELKLIAHGNSIYLEDEEYFPFFQLISGENGQLQMQATPEKIGRQDYIEDVHLEFTADARVTSKPERISEARDNLTMILQSPLQENVQLVDYAFRKIFEVSDGWDYLAKMGPPPQPPPPPQPQSQETENAGFFNEKDHPVLPDDNHIEHIAKIDELQNSPLHEHMSSTGKQLLDRHKRAHVAQFYLQLQATQQQTGIPIHELAKEVGLGRVAPGPAGAVPGGGNQGQAGQGAAPPPGPGQNGVPGGSPPV